MFLGLSLDSLAREGVTVGVSRFSGTPLPPMLTDTAIRNAKPREKPYKLSGGGGLYLLINPSGSRWWRLKYRVAGKEKLLSLGVSIPRYRSSKRTTGVTSAGVNWRAASTLE